MIKLNGLKQRDEERQIAYFTIDGYEYADGSIPTELDTDKKVLIWLKNNENRYMFLILQEMYRDGETWADWQRYQKEDMTDLEAFQKWIKTGHKNRTIVGYKDEERKKPIYEYKVIPKQPWHSTHPPGLVLKADIAKAKTVKDIKKILEKMTDNI